MLRIYKTVEMWMAESLVSLRKGRDMSMKHYEFGRVVLRRGLPRQGVRPCGLIPWEEITAKDAGNE